MTQNEFTQASTLQRHIYELVKAYETCDQFCLAQHDVTAAQGYALLSLPSDGSLTMNELSNSLGVAISTMTRNVDQLVRKGLVQRVADETDRRVVRVELTSQGQSVRTFINHSLQDFFSKVLHEIPAGEQSQVLRSLVQLSGAISAVFKRCC